MACKVEFWTNIHGSVDVMTWCTHACLYRSYWLKGNYHIGYIVETYPGELI